MLSWFLLNGAFSFQIALNCLTLGVKRHKQSKPKRKNQVAVWGWSHSAEVRVQNQWAELISSNIKLGLATRLSIAEFQREFSPKADCMRKAEGSWDISYRKDWGLPFWEVINTKHTYIYIYKFCLVYLLAIFSDEAIKNNKKNAENSWIKSS